MDDFIIPIRLRFESNSETCIQQISLFERTPTAAEDSFHPIVVASAPAAAADDLYRLLLTYSDSLFTLHERWVECFDRYTRRSNCVQKKKLVLGR